MTDIEAANLSNPPHRYRVWDLINKKWFNPETIVLYDNLVFETPRDLEDYTPLKPGEYILTYSSGKDDASASPIKVFEGDILVSTDGKPTEYDVFIVKLGDYINSPDLYYDIKIFGFYGCRDNVKRGRRKEAYKDSITYLIDDMNCVVAGNIFEVEHPLEVLKND